VQVRMVGVLMGWRPRELNSTITTLRSVSPRWGFIID